MTNPFVTYSERFVRSRPQRERVAKVVRSEADAPMVPTPAEKAVREHGEQLRRYRAAWKETLDDARKSTQGEAIIALERFLRGVGIDDGEAIVDYVKLGCLGRHDVHIRHVMLHLIAERLARIRVENGLAPYDDSLPGEQPTVFEIVRAELMR